MISNYNGAKLNILQDCLTSFKKIDYPNYELILVDNASTDNSIDIATKVLGKNPRFKIIKNPINIYSQGLNLGIKAAKGEYVAYFNNDVAIEKGYFHKLIESFDKYP
ncbi:MAG: glycosyltransferase, partial [Candidatus Daviesbacteria bacterium]|nr:glycosyltransferase [Candidatus Daviesbacteria bacterium]